MNIRIRIFLTLCCYCLILAGIGQDKLWVIIAGAFLAGRATTKLILEIIEERKGAQDENSTD